MHNIPCYICVYVDLSKFCITEKKRVAFSEEVEASADEDGLNSDSQEADKDDDFEKACPEAKYREC